MWTLSDARMKKYTTPLRKRGKIMEKNALFILSALFLGAFATGCATIMHGAVQEIPVSSSPTGATVVVDDGLRFKTPTTLILSRKDPHKLAILMEGHETNIVDLKPSVSGAMAGNILFGGLVGLTVDAGSGAAYTLTPEVVHVELVPLPAHAAVSSTVSDVNANERVDKPTTEQLNP